MKLLKIYQTERDHSKVGRIIIIFLSKDEQEDEEEIPVHTGKHFRISFSRLKRNSSNFLLYGLKSFMSESFYGKDIRGHSGENENNSLIHTC